MNLGCPVLASVAGIPELLDEEYLHKPGDINGLSNHIKKYLNDSSLLSNMAKINFSKALEYSSEKLNNRRNQFWKRVTKECLTNNGTNESILL